MPQIPLAQRRSRLAAALRLTRQQRIVDVDFVNLPLPHLIVGLLALVMLYLTANRTSFCILRRKNIPREAARIISGILSAAFFIFYLFVGLVVYFTVFSPQRSEIVRALMPPPQDVLPSAPTAHVPQQVQAPLGRMAAEENWSERQRLLAEMTDHVIRAAVELHQLAGQKEQPYVVAEGISGTEDRYLPPDAATGPSDAETTISVQKPVTFADEISAYFNDATPQVNAGQQNFAAWPTASAEQNSLTGSNMAAAVPTVPALPPPAYPTQQALSVQSAQLVSCGDIRTGMDATDMQIFRAAMRQPEGVPKTWKGPGGSYTVTPGAIKGSCREYSIQADVQGRLMRCQASCASLDQAIEAAALNTAPKPQQRNDDEAVILQSMNNSDQDILIKALTYSGPVSWRSESGIFYTVSPVRLGNPCREYRVKANIRGQVHQYLESNCP